MWHIEEKTSINCWDESQRQRGIGYLLKIPRLKAKGSQEELAFSFGFVCQFAWMQPRTDRLLVFLPRVSLAGSTRAGASMTDSIQNSNASALFHPVTSLSRSGRLIKTLLCLFLQDERVPCCVFCILLAFASVSVHDSVAGGDRRARCWRSPCEAGRPPTATTSSRCPASCSDGRDGRREPRDLVAYCHRELIRCALGSSLEFTIRSQQLKRI